MSADASQVQQSLKPEVYKIGIARQLVLWIMFIVFLPFFISMPVMVFMRATHGQITDAIALGGIFILAMLAMGFIVLQILTMGRTRIELHNDKIDLVVPSWRGPTPFGPVLEKEIPYRDISAIQQRGELYTLGGVLGVRQASCVTTNDGERYILGYMTENDADSPIPFQKISKSLSEKIAKPIEHKGCVNAGTQLGALFKGAPSWDLEPLQKDDVEKVRRRSERVGKLFLIGFFVLLFSVIGIALYPEIIALFEAETPS